MIEVTQRVFKPMLQQILGFSEQSRHGMNLHEARTSNSLESPDTDLLNVTVY